MSDDDKAATNPEVGDTFAVPLGGGRYGAVRVIQACGEERSALIAVTPYLSDKLPSLDDPRLREILREHRFRFSGGWAATWFDGPPPSDHVYLGSLAPSDEEATYDASGRYGGDWSASIANPVVWELDPAGSTPDAKPNDDAPTPAPMPEDDFWAVIALLDTASPEGRDAAAVQRLAELDPVQLGGFEEQLARKLYALDAERFAREIGAHAYGSGDYFSPDLFLYARCAAVACGRSRYERLLRDPGLMPKDEEYEELLTLGDQAHRQATASPWLFTTTVSYETYANASGWGSPAG